jgi:hypothetical protein
MSSKLLQWLLGHIIVFDAVNTAWFKLHKYEGETECPGYPWKRKASSMCAQSNETDRSRIYLES